MKKRFNKMFHAHSAIMLLIEPESGRIVDANLAAVEFYGYSLEEIIGKSIDEINMLDAKEVYHLRMKARQKGQMSFRFPHKTKYGTTKIVDVQSSPIELDDKQYLFSIITDVTEQVDNESIIYKQNEMLRITLDSIGDGVVVTDNNGNITSINKTAVKIIGLYKSEVEGRAFSDVFEMHDEYTGQLVEDIALKVVYTQKKLELAKHTTFKAKNGKVVYIEYSAAPIWDLEHRMQGVVIIFRDVTKMKEKNHRIQFLSNYDTLTGVMNRRLFYDKYESSLIENKAKVAVIMADINGLKMINDVFGFRAGDNVIKKVADIVKEHFGRECKVFRWDGDEFVIFVENPSEKEVEKKLIALKHKFTEPIVDNGTLLNVSISAGYSITEDFSVNYNEILRRAEEVMYQTKLLESGSMRNNMIQTLLATLNEKSEETKEHTDRLTRYCQVVGQCLDIRQEDLDRLSLLSLLHDIGKVAIPEHILHKTGSLNDEEWIIMKTHSDVGARIAANVPECIHVSDEIKHHHERWDGNGYPDRLKEDQIPLNCRILSVVDAYDAMTNDRVYRKALTHDQAVQELRNNAGRQFDPNIVKIFIDKVLINSSNSK